MVRKTISLLLGVTLALSLCACGGGNTQSQKTENIQDAAVTAEGVSETTETGQGENPDAADAADAENAAAADTADAENAAAAAQGRTETYSEMGITLDYPAEFFNTKGHFEPYINGEVVKGINLMSFNYIAMSDEAYNKLLENDDPTEEELEDFRAKAGAIFDLIAIDQGRGAEDIIRDLGSEGVEPDLFIEIGKADDVTFFMVDEAVRNEDFAQNVDAEYAQEFMALHDSLDKVLRNAKFSVPVAPGSEYIGQKISFETTDVNGNPVKSEDIFKENKVTMINVWATWCGPCKGELKALGEMHRSYAGKGAAVVGFCIDADEELEECKKLIAENEIDYLNLLPFEGYMNVIPTPCYPVSYFVDSEGTIIAPPVQGAPADMSTYEEIIDDLLGKE